MRSMKNKWNRQIKRCMTLGVLASVLGFAASSEATLIVTNRYDFEPSGGVTETGWTHVDTGDFYTLTTAGFMPGSSFAGDFDRVTSTQPPTDVTRDAVFSTDLAPTVMTIGFRDIIPAFSESVIYSIYRSDPADVWAPDFSTYISVNGGPTNLVHSGTAVNGTYFAPITGLVTLTPTMTLGTIDFLFFDNGGDPASVRLNGIQTEFTVVPEPSTMLLLGVGAAVVLRMRRRLR